MSQTEIKPVMQFTIEPKDYDGYTRNFEVFKLSDFKPTPGFKIPRYWDANMEMHFPDWAKLSSEMTDEADRISQEALAVSVLTAYQGRPGDCFRHEPYVSIYSKFVVVRQTAGLDI